MVGWVAGVMTQEGWGAAEGFVTAEETVAVSRVARADGVWGGMWVLSSCKQPIGRQLGRRSGRERDDQKKAY